MSIPKEANDIINRSRQGAPGAPAQPESGVTEAPPASAPVAETVAQPTEEPRQTEGDGSSESEQRVPLSRLKKALADKNQAKEASESSQAELAQLREKVAQLEAEKKLAAVVSGEGKPGNWDDLDDLQKMAWFQEQTSAAPAQPTVQQPQVADDISAKWAYVEAGFSIPQAGVLHSIASANPSLSIDDVMVLAENRSPDLFSQGGSQQGAEIPTSHQVGAPRPTRSQVTKPDAASEARAGLLEAMGKPKNVKERAALDYLRQIRGK